LWLIADTFDPEVGAEHRYLDLNTLSNEELLPLVAMYPVAREIIEFRESAPASGFNFNDILEYLVFVSPLTRKIQAIYLVGGLGPLKRVGADWIPVDRTSDQAIEGLLAESLLYKADYSRLLDELPEIEDEDDDEEMAITRLDAAFDDGTITEELVKEYSVLLTNSEGTNPSIDYL
jgi:hypothetical protein